MDVRAVFELPVPIWIVSEALGKSYPTGYRNLTFHVSMPSDQPPVGAPLRDFEDHSSAGESSAGELEMWTQQYPAFIPPSLEPATALLRVGLAGVDGPIVKGREWATPDHQLAEAIDGWFDEVRTWTEVFTGQDLDPWHRVYHARPVGAGLTFIEPPHEGTMGVILETPRVRPLTEPEWALLLERIGQGAEPPLEEVLSRDARASIRRNANRRAIIEAATALEIVFARHVRSLEAALPEKQQERLNMKPPPALGGYISIAEVSKLPLAVSIDRLRDLKDLRNAAAHRGESPSSLDASAAVQVMIDFLSEHGRYRRTGEKEPDGSEWVALPEAP